MCIYFDWEIYDPRDHLSLTYCHVIRLEKGGLAAPHVDHELSVDRSITTEVTVFE